jgi:hypothetical protein
LKIIITSQIVFLNMVRLMFSISKNISMSS